MTCHPHISHILSCSWQNTVCTASLLVFLPGWVCFGVLCVYRRMCANLSMCCSSSTALPCHSNLLHSGWKHHFDTWTDKAVFGSIPLQQLSPAALTSLTQHLKMPLLWMFLFSNSLSFIADLFNFWQSCLLGSSMYRAVLCSLPSVLLVLQNFSAIWRWLCAIHCT